MDREPTRDLETLAEANSSYCTFSVDTANCASGTVRLALSQGRLDATRLLGKPLVSKVRLEAYQERTQPDGVPRVGRPRTNPAPGGEDPEIQ